MFVDVISYMAVGNCCVSCVGVLFSSILDAGLRVLLCSRAHQQAYMALEEVTPPWWSYFSAEYSSRDARLNENWSQRCKDISKAYNMYVD